jgi:uncharacterized protein with HEPN domain
VPSRQVARRFREIITDIERIERYCRGLDFARFRDDEKTADAVERCLGRISEAAVKLGDEAQALCPGQPWPDIRGLGNHLRHGYDMIDLRRVWRTVVVDLPPLKAACLETLARLAPPEVT